MPTLGRWVRVALVAVAASVALTGPLGSAHVHADSPAALGALLDDCDGVVVVVDPGQPLPPPTATCIPTQVPDGIAALIAAGHTLTFVPGIPGMICTIDDQPQPCNGAPVSAYWSYWLGTAEGWTYSSRGAGFRAADPAIVEGWRFGDGSQPPRIAPAATGKAVAVPAAESDASPNGATATTMVGIGLLGAVVAMAAVRQRRRTTPAQDDSQ